MVSLKGSLPRCVHSVFTTHTSGGTDNDVCSICRPVRIGEKEILKTLLIKIDGSWKNLAKK